ncbi:hypothetical protein [Alkalihalobacillus sp. LMS6]|nr:hypothetical protein [Alkalihalobacillus sp. LMS6]
MRRLYYRYMYRLTGNEAYLVKIIGLTTRKYARIIAKGMKDMAPK